MAHPRNTHPCPITCRNDTQWLSIHPLLVSSFYRAATSRKSVSARRLHADCTCFYRRTNSGNLSTLHGLITLTTSRVLTTERETEELRDDSRHAGGRIVHSWRSQLIVSTVGRYRQHHASLAACYLSLLGPQTGPQLR